MIKIDESLLEPDEVREVVAIGDEHALNHDMTRLPGDVAYYGGRYAEARGVLQQRKREVEVIEAQLYLEYKGGTMANGKPATEEYVKASIVLDPRYKATRDTLDAVSVLVNRIGAVCDGISAKREMVISLGANYRAEHAPTPRVNTGETALSASKRRFTAESE